MDTPEHDIMIDQESNQLVLHLKSMSLEKVTSKMTLEETVTLRLTIKSRLDCINVVFGPDIDRLKTDLKDIQEERTNVSEQLLELDKLAKTAIEEWANAQILKSKVEDLKISARIREQTIGDLNKAIIAAASDSDVGSVVELSTELTKVKEEALICATTVKIPGVAILKRWRIVDGSMIHDEFILAPTPDTVKIGRLVNSDYAHAQDIVGGIEVYEVPSARRTK